MLSVELRDFILEHFSRDELLTFCADYFRDFYQDYAGVSVPNSTLVRELVEQCQRRGEIEKLQAGLQRARTQAYVARFGRLKVLDVKTRPRDARQVFLSHAHEDANFAQRLAADLRAEGVPVWVAPDSIQPGESWMSAIDRGLGESGICVVALTPHAVQSSWVKSETEFALQEQQLGHGSLYPLMVRSCDVRQLSNLLTTRQHINFERDYAAGLAELFRSLGVQSAAERERARRDVEARQKEADERDQQKERQRHAVSEVRNPLNTKNVLPEREAAVSTQAEIAPDGKQLSRRRLLQIIAAGGIGGLGIVAAGWLARLQQAQPGVITPQPVPDDQSAAATQAQEISSPENRFVLELAPGLTMAFVRVPSGDFQMGSDSAKDTHAQSNEMPKHAVYLSEYFVGITEITNAHYAAYAQATGISFAIPDGASEYPVVNVSWNDATAFVKWASMKTGRLVRLPSEAEWEKAARGADGRIYPWGNESDTSKANTVESGKGATTPVGAFSPGGDSPFGVADMSGNVYEWCADAYDEKAYEKRSGQVTRDPFVNSGALRVVRSGSFNGSIYGARVARRDGSNPDDRGHLIGFRVAIGDALVPA